MAEKRHRTLLTSLVAAVALTAAGLLAGCQGIGIMFGQDQMAQAEYTLTKAPLLVLVEENSAGGGDAFVRYHLQRTLIEQLRKNNVNQQVVPDSDVRLFQMNNPMSARWSAAQMGKAMQVEQVVHIQIEPFIEDSEMLDPTRQVNLAASVRVFDVATRGQVWPIESKGRQVFFRMKASDLHAAEKDADTQKALAVGLADRVAKLFYDHPLMMNESARRNAEDYWSK